MFDCLLVFFPPLNRMEDSVSSSLNESMLEATPAATTNSDSYLQDVHQHHKEDDVYTSSFNSNSTLAGYYQSWPLCVLQNSTMANNISEPEKLYFPLFEFVISLVLLVVVALPGLVGNFISIFILSRPQMRTSLNVILIGGIFLFIYLLKIIYFHSSPLSPFVVLRII